MEFLFHTYDVFCLMLFTLHKSKRDSANIFYTVLCINTEILKVSVPESLIVQEKRVYSKYRRSMLEVGLICDGFLQQTV